MTTSEHSAGTVLVRNGIVLFGVGLVSAVCVYIGNEWFHTIFLPRLGIGSAVGDALGDFFIIIVAFIGQRLASLAFFDDIYFGLLGYARQLQMAKDAMHTELGELGDLASTDKLTGAWNRRRFEELIRGEMERLARYDHALSLLMIDIDHFKTINDHCCPVN